MGITRQPDKIKYCKGAKTGALNIVCKIFSLSKGKSASITWHFWNTRTILKGEFWMCIAKMFLKYLFFEPDYFSIRISKTLQSSHGILFQPLNHFSVDFHHHKRLLAPLQLGRFPYPDFQCFWLPFARRHDLVSAKGQGRTRKFIVGETERSIM